jgi:hypothetical protein
MSDSEVEEEGGESGEPAQESEEKAEDGSGEESSESNEAESEEAESEGDDSGGDDSEGGDSEDDEERKRAEAQAAERRKAYRLNKVLGATMTSTDGDATRTRLFVIDISASGFRATDHRPPDEDECDISIVLVKDADPFVSRMRVVWVKELTVSGMYQMGCEFVDIAEEEQAKLNDFIDQEKNKAAKASGSKSPIKINNPWTMI